jgi:cytochrome c
VSVRKTATVLALALLGGCGRTEQNATGSSAPARFGLGRPAAAEDIAAWDIDVAPDGAGLPAGTGTVAQGTTIYARKCGSCHGPTGTEGPFDRLVGREPRQGFPFGRDPNLTRTIGNYWPYATTLYDYINRAMPLEAPGSLSPNEVYSLVAFLLWRNEIIPSTARIDAHTLPAVVMPAHDRFVLDNRRGGPEVR